MFQYPMDQIVRIELKIDNNLFNILIDLIK